MFVSSYPTGLSYFRRLCRAASAWGTSRCFWFFQRRLGRPYWCYNNSPKCTSSGDPVLRPRQSATTTKGRHPVRATHDYSHHDPVLWCQHVDKPRCGSSYIRAKRNSELTSNTAYAAVCTDKNFVRMYGLRDLSTQPQHRKELVAGDLGPYIYKRTVFLFIYIPLIDKTRQSFNPCRNYWDPMHCHFEKHGAFIFLANLAGWALSLHCVAKYPKYVPLNCYNLSSKVLILTCRSFLPSVQSILQKSSQSHWRL